MRSAPTALLAAFAFLAVPAFATPQPAPASSSSAPDSCRPLIEEARKIALPRFNEQNLLRRVELLEARLAHCDPAGASMETSETTTALLLLDAKMWQLHGRSHDLRDWQTFASLGYDVEPDSQLAGDSGTTPPARPL